MICRDLGLRHRQVARQVGANADTVKNCEMGHTAPALWFVPRIIRFLGYVPFDATGDSSPLSRRLTLYRRIRGLSQKRIAVMLGVDPNTLARWESGRGKPNNENADKIEALPSLASFRPTRLSPRSPIRSDRHPEPAERWEVSSLG